MTDAIWLTVKLAAVSTTILIMVGTPLAWWLARSKVWWKEGIGAVVTLPIVLPPTVLGFYLLIGLSPTSPLGRAAEHLLGHSLPFSFEGLVVALVLHSLPFVVQPIRNAFEAIGPRPLQVAATLRASSWDRFFTIAVPLARAGLISAALLGFAHSVGEFGVVLMIGGSIPGETKVLSIAIYEYVEMLYWNRAHLLAGCMLAFSFFVILATRLIDTHLSWSRQ